jgi:hypothetical protein
MAGTGYQEEIRKLLSEMIEAQNSGDAPRLRSLLSERADAVHIGTDAAEWWTSGQVVDAVAAVGGGDDIRAVADDIDVHVLGDIAWAEGRGRFTRADGAERPVRMTGVLAREDGSGRSCSLTSRSGSRTRTSSADAQANPQRGGSIHHGLHGPPEVSGTTAVIPPQRQMRGVVGA